METIELFKKSQKIAELSYSIGDTIHIESVYVNLDSRNKGIGTALINQVISIAKQQGKNVSLTPTNGRNARLYRRLGFKRVKKDYYLLNTT